MKIKKLVLCVAVILLLSANADEYTNEFRALQDECERYAHYYIESSSTITNNFTTTGGRLIQKDIASCETAQTSNTLSGCSATNVVYEIKKIKNKICLTSLTARYATGWVMRAEYADRRVVRIYKQVGSKKYRTIEVNSREPQTFLCYDSMEIGDGEDFILSNIRRYKNGRFVSEEPSQRFSALLFKNITGDHGEKSK